MSKIQTHTGIMFDPLDPDPDLINIEDIAHSLSMQCRFNGHCTHFYSVAHHSYLVSYYVNNPLAGLLHDAPEAYIVDIPSPIKRSGHFEIYRSIEEKIAKAVYKKFGLPDGSFETDDLKEADKRMLASEKRDLMAVNVDWGWNVKPYDDVEFELLTPSESKDLFIKRYYELINGNV
jgi:hypothetical protein